MANNTEKTGNAPEDAEGTVQAASDVQSDPAKSDEAGDWTGEGGATPTGPATDTESNSD